MPIMQINKINRLADKSAMGAINRPLRSVAGLICQSALFCHTYYPAFVTLCIILCIFSACSANPFNQPTETHKTPTPAIAGGEPVLPHSQIHIHDAPLPSQ